MTEFPDDPASAHADPALNHWFVTLTVVDTHLARLRQEVTPDGIKPDTALAVGYAMGVVAKARSLLQRDLATAPHNLATARASSSPFDQVTTDPTRAPPRSTR